MDDSRRFEQFESYPEELSKIINFLCKIGLNHAWHDTKNASMLFHHSYIAYREQASVKLNYYPEHHLVEGNGDIYPALILTRLSMDIYHFNTLLIELFKAGIEVEANSPPNYLPRTHLFKPKESVSDYEHAVNILNKIGERMKLGQDIADGQNPKQTLAKPGLSIDSLLPPEIINEVCQRITLSYDKWFHSANTEPFVPPFLKPPDSSE